jgi:malonyl CoA-acyl carrier protein transacylase
MIKDGVGEFIEVGPGHVLRNLIKRIDSSVKTISITNEDDIKNLRLE